MQGIFKFNSMLWVLGGALLALDLALAITVAIQQHSDRALEAEIERCAARLQDLGGQIAEIKDVHLVSMNDYIGAYAQVANPRYYNPAELSHKARDIGNPRDDLPSGNRALRFWHEQFLPLEAEERALRERLRMVGDSQ